MLQAIQTALLIHNNHCEERMMKLEWEDGARIRIKVIDSQVVISANREGLLSLQRQLASLAEETPGSHIHYDEYNALEEGSTELIIEKE